MMITVAILLWSLGFAAAVDFVRSATKKRLPPWRMGKRRYEWRYKSGRHCSGADSDNACTFWLESHAKANDAPVAPRTLEDEAKDPAQETALFIHVAATGERVTTSGVRGERCRLHNEPDLPHWNLHGKTVRG